MKKKICRKKIIDTIIFIATAILLSFFIILDKYSKISLVLGGVILLILFFSLFRRKITKKIRVESYHKFMFIFTMYCFLSSLWSAYPQNAIEKGNTIFQLLICFTVLYSVYKYYPTEKLLKCTLYSSIIVTLYTVYNKGIMAIWNTLTNGQRLEVDFANINSISEIGAIGVIIMFYYIFYKKKYMYIFFMGINIFIIAASGSRKSLALPIIGCFLLIILKTIEKKGAMKNILKITILSMLFCLSVKFILSLPIFSMINARINGLISTFMGSGKIESSALTRKLMISLGIEQFIKTPFLGIGIGNSGPIILAGTRYSNSYLHNNFVELLACGGMIGFFIYYSMYIYIFYTFLKKWKYRTDETILCFVLCFCILFLDYGQVSYYSKTTYFYLMVFFLEVYKMEKRKKHLKYYVKKVVCNKKRIKVNI